MVQQRIQFRIRGSLFVGEEWSVNPNFIGNFDDLNVNQGDLTQWATDVLAEIGSGAYGGILTAMSSAATIDAVDAYFYNAAGVLARQATVQRATPLRGTGSANLPAAASIVASLNTGIPGRRYRGRIYWPACGLTISTAQGALSTTQTQAIATQTASLLGAMADAAPADVNAVPAVYSQANGTGAAVVQVRVGDQVDSQRRRREGLVESYVVANVL